MRKYILLNSNLSKDEDQMLIELMEDAGYTSRSAYVKHLLRQEYKRQNPEAEQARARKAIESIMFRE